MRGAAEHLFTTDPLPGQVRTRGDVFRWRDVVRRGEATDPEESHSAARWVPVSQAPELVGGNWMLDSVAATALMYHYAAPFPA